jgi:arylsulfatase
MRRLFARRKAEDGAAGPRPNILFIMTDQQRWDALGCAGGWVETPNMDRIAAEGVRFPNAYTNSPLCVPARVSLAVGRYPHNHNVRRTIAYTLPPEQPTWMRAIRDAGYSTSVFGKTHLHPQSGDLRDREHLVRAYGLDHVDEIAGPRASLASRSNLTDRWEEAGVYEAYKRDLQERFANKPWVARPSPLPLDLYPDAYVGQQAADYLRAYDDARPWFCWVSFPGPHEPWDAPEPYAGRYDPGAMPPPIQPSGDGRDRPRGILDRKLERGFLLDPGDVPELRANYAGKVTLIDDQIGAVLGVVEARGEMDRTVVAFVSDHGEMNGDYGLIYKGTFLNPAVRVPFLVRVPGRTGGAVVDTVVELMDVGATLVELAGGSQVPGSLARSLLPVLARGSRRHRKVALSEVRREIMLATNEWKAALNRDGEIYLLFDLPADPAETRNVAALPEYRKIERRLHRQVKKTVEAAR